jgi:tRNA(Ile)-lysidine synthase
MMEKDPESRPIRSSDWQAILSAVATAWPAARWCNVGVVVGCSGGADSVALLRAVCELRQQQPEAKGFVVAAHFHHGIRGQAADEDAEFVSQLAQSCGIRHQQGKASEPAADEASMRAARAAFLRQLAQSTGARYVAVAHSADDNVETVLHHLMRGTGPKGLAGMPISRAMGHDPIGQDLVLIRPLLGVRRDVIRLGLRQIGQSWREDLSNDDTSYRRNWIRAELLPMMETHYPHVVDAVTRAIDLQQTWLTTIEDLADDWIDGHVSMNEPVEIRRDDSCPPPVLIAALQRTWSQQAWPLGEMTQEHWARLAATIRSDDDQRYSLPGNIDVRAGSSHVRLLRKF